MTLEKLASVNPEVRNALFVLANAMEKTAAEDTEFSSSKLRSLLRS